MSTQVLPEVHAASRSRVPARYVPYLLAAGFVALAWLLYHALSPQPKFPLDDPYITLHSAQVLHWGHDPNYPGVSPLYGATSAPFLGLVYLLLFFLHPLRALETAGWLGILAYTLGLAYLTRVLRLSRPASLAIVALGLVSSFAPIHLLNGLETCWAMAGIVWTLSLASEGRFKLAALVAGLTAAIRPDLVTFAVPVFAALVSMQPDGKRWEFVRRAVPLAALPIVLCAFWYFAQTGYPFPLTGVAKQYYSASSQLPLAEKLFTVIAASLMYMVSSGPLLVGIKRIHRAPLALATIACIGLLLLSIYIQFPRGLMVNRFRYPVVIVPMLVWAVAVDAARRSSRNLLIGCLAYALLLPLQYTVRCYRNDRRYFDSSLRATAEWCNQNLPPDARILVQDAGYIAYATHFRILDFVGLKTPEAITFNREYTRPTAGRGRAQAVSALAAKEQGDYLISLKQRSDSTNLPQELRALGWQVSLLKSFPPYAIYRIQRQPSAR
jgi:hypothetical protein